MSEVVHEPSAHHLCDLPPPNSHLIGTVARCECGRTWRLSRESISFKNWRGTLRSRILHGRHRQSWASAHRTPED